MNSTERMSDHNLNAYIDDELDEIGRAEVEAWLADHPQDAARVEAYKDQNRELHQLFDPVIGEPLPPEFSELLDSLPVKRAMPAWMRTVAAVILLVIGAAGGWGIRNFQDRPAADKIPSYVERAVGAHLVYTAEVLHPVEVAADQEAHLVGWLSKRLGAPLRAPSLVSLGFHLIGGRLLEDGGSPAAQFMFEDNGGRRITVYARSDNGKDTAFKFFGNDEASAFYWVDGPFAYALAGDMPRQELMKVARIVYEDLAP
jgi:anti-sigma factor RsiW